MLAAKFLGPRRKQGEGRLGRMKYVVRARKMIAVFFERWDVYFEKVSAAYKRGLLWCLGNRIKVLAATGVLFLLSFVLLSLVGGEFTPYSDQGYISVDVTMPSQATLDDTERVMEEIARIARAHPEVVTLSTTVGGQNKGINEGELIIQLVPLADRDMITSNFVNVLRPELAGIPGADIVIMETSSGPSASADVIVEVTGPDLSEIRKLSGEMRTFMAGTQGLVDVSTSEKAPKPEIRFVPDRYLISSLGINTAAVYSALRTSFEGDVPSVFRDKGKEYDIRVRLVDVDRSDEDSFSEVMIGTPKGVVPVARLGEVIGGAGESEILRKNRQNLINVTANIGTGILSQYENLVTSKKNKMDIPEGYSINLGGSSENKAESFASLFQALFMAIILTYIVLAAMLESFIHPFTIMLTLPLGLIGVSVALFFGGQTVNMMSLMAIVMLVGIVVNNAILILDYTNQLRDEGMVRRDALVQACYVRFRPIVMMNLAIALAIVPQVMGNAESGFQKSMGVATIGGILISTIFTIFLIPVIYEYMDRFTKQGKLEAKQG